MRPIVLSVFALLGVACSSSDGGDGGGMGVDGGFVADLGTSDAVVCPDGTKTTVSGIVHSPAKSGADPIYNAVVFIPDGEVPKFKTGATCDRCGELGGAKAVTSALTGSDGVFHLENVPPGKNVPFVVQIGKWRRQVTIPEVTACGDTKLPDELTRLPRNQAEGDIPLTAIVTGRADPLECVLRKIGIDDAEFSVPLVGSDYGHGRMHVFKSPLGVDMSSGTVSGHSLTKNLDWLKRFDVVLLPCDGSSKIDEKPPADMQNLVDYANAGGRVFTTHYGFVWIQQSPDAGWKAAATWVPGGTATSPLPGFIDTSFPKGKAMAEWLKAVGASTTLGQIDIADPRVDAPKSNAPSQSWITSKAPAGVQHFTFNTPTTAAADAQCGRVVYSDFHVVGSSDFSPIIFPNECTDGPLTAQERVIEFMLFDLASCVQKDDATPKPPR